jgi:pimeloyl-ACP methyl ester carboxylesterase
LDAWREAIGLDAMIFVAHSLGAFFSSAYAIRHPKRVLKLILVSPAGFVSSNAPCQRQRHNKELLPTRNRDDKGFIYFVLNFLWRWNITPLHIVRKLYYLAPLAVAKFVRDRLTLYCAPTLHRSLFDYSFALTFAEP